MNNCKHFSLHALIILAVAMWLVHAGILLGANNGCDLNFEAIVNYPVGIWCTDLASGDLDGDGDIDLAVASVIPQQVLVLLNNSDGTFSQGGAYPVGEGPWSVAVRDLDGDGDIDLAVANAFSNDISILPNQGNGTFAAAVNYPMGASARGIAAGDLDGDGDIDLAVAVAGNFTGNVSVMLNSGDGTFMLIGTYDTWWETTESVTIADLNGNGHLDLVTSDVSVLLNYGDGTFTDAMYIPGGDWPSDVTAADLDDDGDIDVVSADCFIDEVLVFLNQGGGTFASGVNYGVGDRPQSVAAGDLDGDGDLDLAVANYGFGNVSILLNEGNGTFAEAVDFAAGDWPRSVTAGDLNGDGYLDLAVAGFSGGVSVLLNAGCPLEETYSTETTLLETIVSEQVVLENVTVAGDFNSVLDFNGFEIVTIATGAFAGKGFSKGQCQTTLEGTSYTGDWQGVLFHKSDERKIYLKGAILGEIWASVEGYLSESVPESGVYDEYQATWKIGRLGSTITSATINLNGILTYLDSSEYPSTELYLLQTNLEGTLYGDYYGSLSTVINHVRIAEGNNQYDGEGFSIISYVCDSGSGQGWTYDRLVSPGRVELNGLFDSPLFGVATGVLDESGLPRTLFLTVSRVDLGLPPAPDLRVITWGQRRISPGEKFCYLIEIINAGVIKAEEVSIQKELSPLVKFVEASDGFFYNSDTHSVYWMIDEFTQQLSRRLFIQVEAVWGLPGGTIIQDPTYGKHRAQLTNTFYPGINWKLVYDLYKQYQTACNLDSSLRRSYADTDLLSGALHVWLASEGVATEKNYLAYTEGDGQYTIGFSHSGGTQTLFQKIDSGAVQVDYAVYCATALLTQEKVAKQVKDGKVNKVIIMQSPKDALYKIKVRLKQQHLFAIPGPGGYIYYWAPAVIPLEVPEGLPQLWKNEAIDISSLLTENDIDPSVLPEEDDFWIGGASREEQSLFVNEDVDGDGEFDIITITEDFPDIPDSMEIHRALLRRMEEMSQGETYPFDGTFDGLLRNDYPEDQISEFDSVITQAHDPSVKYGPEGRVLPGEKLDYRVEYENEGAGIAFGVYFTDTLDKDLNDSNLEIGPVIDVNDGSIISGPGIYNPATRTITWFAGEVGPNEGGYADFSVNVRSDAENGTEIINFATIYFPSVPEETRTNGIVSIVSLNQPPAASAGGPYIAQATSWSGAWVQLDGTGSSDPDDDAITYEWDLDLSVDSDGDSDPNNDVDANEPMPEVLFPIGQTEISLVVTDEYGLRSEPDVTTVTVSFIEVDVDIKPGSFPNAINLGSHGVIPVAFLSDSGFDASTIDPATVTLRGEDFADGLVKLRGKKDAPVPMSNLEDVDDDGDLDLVVHLETEKLAEYEIEAICKLGALTYDGYVVSGSDTIQIVPK